MREIFDLSPEEQAARNRNILIGQQNDRFRSTWGADYSIHGQIVVTRAVAELPPSGQALMMQAVQNFSTFDENNDPYLDHTFGAFEIEVADVTIRLFWKIDGVDAPSHNGIVMCQTGFVRSQTIERKHP